MPYRNFLKNCTVNPFVMFLCMYVIYKRKFWPPVTVLIFKWSTVRRYMISPTNCQFKRTIYNVSLIYSIHFLNQNELKYAFLALSISAHSLFFTKTFHQSTSTQWPYLQIQQHFAFLHRNPQNLGLLYNISFIKPEGTTTPTQPTNSFLILQS